MAQYEERFNQQMEAMLTPARERLKKYSILELCEKGNIKFDETKSEFSIRTLGKDVKVHYPDFVIDENLSMWHHLTLLQYMDTANGEALTGKYIGLREMRGGLSRGDGFDKDIALMFKRDFSDIDKESFKEACRKLGGEIVDGKADACAVIYYAPMFPILINFWEADDEFPASGKALVDAAGENYLTLEAAGGACSAVVMGLRSILGKGNNSDKDLWVG